METDQDLIAKAAAGDLEAFGRLVDRHQERLFRAMFHLLGSREDAEDATQDAWVRVFQNLGRYDGRSAFYTWLFRIAYNAAISRRRRKRPRISLQEQPPGWDAEEDRAPPPEQAVQRENVALVWQAIDQLPDDQRDILILREMEAMAYEEIAQTLGIPPGTVKSRLFRARAELRERLKDRFESAPAVPPPPGRTSEPSSSTRAGKRDA